MWSPAWRRWRPARLATGRSAFAAAARPTPSDSLLCARAWRATAREQQKIRYAAQRKRRHANPRSLRAAAFIYVLTDLPADVLPASEALELYRLRWQIELAFKRLKSILKLDHLRAHDPRLAKTYLYGKLLVALILDELSASALAFFPWGFPLTPDTRQSLALADIPA